MIMQCYKCCFQLSRSKLSMSNSVKEGFLQSLSCSILTNAHLPPPPPDTPLEAGQFASVQKGPYKADMLKLVLVRI